MQLNIVVEASADANKRKPTWNFFACLSECKALPRLVELLEEHSDIKFFKSRKVNLPADVNYDTLRHISSYKTTAPPLGKASMLAAGWRQFGEWYVSPGTRAEGCLEICDATSIANILHNEGLPNQRLLAVLNMMRTIVLVPNCGARIIYWLETDDETKAEGAGRGRAGTSARAAGGHRSQEGGRSHQKVA